ncbi:MAG: VCBS repeat-containing protein [Bacteroidales bacterium]
MAIFWKKDLLPGEEGDTKLEEELGVLFFDADGDGDEDLYLVSGGYEYEAESEAYRDRLFRNESGRSVPAPEALPEVLSSGSCVRAADMDRDGDLDLFVRRTGHSVPIPPGGQQPVAGERWPGNLALAGADRAGGLTDLGLISDALWTDVDGDGWTDLLLAGEWMPLVWIKNEEGRLGDGAAAGRRQPDRLREQPGGG